LHDSQRAAMLVNAALKAPRCPVPSITPPNID
jgi:hypothetical protein